MVPPALKKESPFFGPFLSPHSLSLTELTQGFAEEQELYLFLLVRNQSEGSAFGSGMICLGRALSLSGPINRVHLCNFHCPSSRFSAAKPKLSSKWRCMASDPDSSSFAPSIDAEPSDKNAAGYSLSLSLDYMFLFGCREFG